MIRPTTSLAGEPLLLHRGVLHRVDARSLAADQGVSLGALCTQNTPDAAAPTPAEDAPDSAFDLRGKDYSDHHGPRSMAEYHAGRALFWRCYLGLVAVVLFFVAKWLIG